MTQLSEKEHNAQMEDMKSFDEQMPSVGIFWYDSEKRAFFGVHKRGVFLIKHPERIESKTGLCGGCVVWNKDKFVVHVGKWAEFVQEELTRLVEADFSLPYFEFEYDEEFESKYR